MTAHDVRAGIDDAVAAVAEAAGDAGITVAVAESLTCGGVVHALGSGPAASEWLAGGVVAYRTDVKERVLGLTPGVDPCSAECAEQLARGARQRLGADVAVSTTGVGGPDPDGGHVPGTVYVGWDDGDRTGHERHAFDGGPQDVIDRTVEAALGRLVALVEHRS